MNEPKQSIACISSARRWGRKRSEAGAQSISAAARPQAAAGPVFLALALRLDHNVGNACSRTYAEVPSVDRNAARVIQIPEPGAPGPLPSQRRSVLPRTRRAGQVILDRSGHQCGLAGLEASAAGLRRLWGNA